MAVTATAGLLAAAVAAAGAVADGEKNAAFAGAISSGIGSGYKIVARRNGIVVLDMTMSGSLGVSSAGISLPDSYASLSTLLAADIDSGTWTLRIEKASDPSVYLEGTIGRSGTDFILSDDLNPALGISLSGIFLQVGLDTSFGGSWIDVGLSDMRRVGWSGSYATSYALNDDRSLQMPSTWTQASRAMLAMGRYPYTPPGGTCEAFTGVNPDVGGLSWVASVEPGALTAVWDKLAFWGEVTLSTTFPSHASGYVGNTRVAVWDCEVWIRLRSTGAWSLVRRSNDLGGMHYRADYAGTNGNIQFRTEPSGYLSFRPLSSTNPAYSAHYWWNVPVYPTINAYEVVDVVVAQKVSLVLHDSAGTDDREFSRFMLRTGADYYPTSNQAFSNNPGVGQSRTKFIRAQWPNWEWGVMHTMTEAEFNAAGGYPAELAGA